MRVCPRCGNEHLTEAFLDVRVTGIQGSPLRHDYKICWDCWELFEQFMAPQNESAKDELRRVGRRSSTDS